MDPWTLVYEGLDPDQEALREALCTLGNGYFATRGASAQVEAGGPHYPGTYLAGGYNRLKTEIAGRIIENEDLVNLPNWLLVKLRINENDWFTPDRAEMLSYRQELHMKAGLLTRDMRFRDETGRITRLRERRLVHISEPHLAALEIRFIAENWSGRLEIESALDGRVVNWGVERYQKLNNRHLEPVTGEEVDRNTVLLRVRTSQSQVDVAQAARTQVFGDTGPIETNRRLLREEGYVAHRFTVDLSEGSEVQIEKTVSLFTSRDHACAECGLEAGKAVSDLSEGFEALMRNHALSWKHLWRRFEINFRMASGIAEDQTAMVFHLNIFHLLQTTSLHTMDMDVGVPSRGWHGEAYRGHIFWDELFIFPFLNLRVPEITRSLLMYRYRRINEARAAAKEAGHRGAMYPWQSGSNGREESQEVHLNPESGRWISDNSRLQRHVNAAVAYNIYQYYQATGDMEFLSFYGAEMILEIARFWSSIATYNEACDRYEILGVMGPDEYHDAYPGADNPGLNNSAYTNVMAVWVLTEALKLLDRLPEDRSLELCEAMDLGRDEIDLWRSISRKMRIVFHDDGIISQFEDYDRLEEFDWEGYRKKYGDIQRLDRILEAEDDTPNRYKVSKQADVLMLFYLFSAEELQRIFEQLGYPFEYETIPKNVDYYRRRTSHGSTLSRVVHSWVLVRSDRERSWQLFKKALKSDYSDIQGGTTPEGIHLGAMAGSVDILQRGYTGMEVRGDALWFNPCLPEELENLQMEIRYRGHALTVAVTGKSLTVSAGRGVEEPIKVGFKGLVFELEALEQKKFEW